MEYSPQAKMFLYEEIDRLKSLNKEQSKTIEALHKDVDKVCNLNKELVEALKLFRSKLIILKQEKSGAFLAIDESLSKVGE
jgi:hypothetical protein